MGYKRQKMEHGIEALRRDRDAFYNGVWSETIEKLENELDEIQVTRLEHAAERLMKGMKNGTNYPDHALLQLICSQYLLKNGYDISVEHWTGSLTCDICAYGRDNLTIEVETGHTYPGNRIYEIVKDRRGREIRKMGLYAHALDDHKFVFCIPSNYSLQLPEEFSIPSGERDGQKIKGHLAICREYCQKAKKTLRPTFEDLMEAELDHILIVDPVNLTVAKKDAREYMSACSVY